MVKDKETWYMELLEESLLQSRDIFPGASLPTLDSLSRVQNVNLSPCKAAVAPVNDYWMEHRPWAALESLCVWESTGYELF